MKRWAGKVAIVTGASGGIGAAIAKALVSHGVKVIGLARRMEKLCEFRKELGKDKFFPVECDVTKEDDILKVFKFAEKEFGGADILVNNAGVVSGSMVIDSPTVEYRQLLETNLIAPTVFSREYVRCLRQRKAPGHIININSIAGQYAETLPIPLGMYGASKYGLRALGTELRHEIVICKLNIKVTNISPGAVLTDMFRRIVGKGESDEKFKAHTLTDKDIAEAVMYALGTPEGVEIPEITIIPHGEIIGIPSSFSAK